MKRHAFPAAVLALTLVLAGTAQAGPIGTYYLTDYVNSANGASTLDAIQGNNIVLNASYFQRQEGAIAVFGSLGVVRTTGLTYGLSGGEYTGVPGLTVAQDGTTYTNAFSYDGAATYDGTTDGSSNYTVDGVTGTVIATNTSWGGPGNVLFSTGVFADAGITYDNTNNSLWIMNIYSGQISDYTLAGKSLFTFNVSSNDPFGEYTALAMDVDHTLWYEDFGTGVIQHFATNGTYLGSEHYAGLGEALGGEITDAFAAPEPASLTLLGIGIAGIAGYRWRTRRTLASRRHLNPVRDPAAHSPPRPSAHSDLTCSVRSRTLPPPDNSACHGRRKDTLSALRP